MKSKYILFKWSYAGDEGDRSVDSLRILERETQLVDDRDRELLRHKPRVSAVAPAGVRMRTLSPKRAGVPVPMSNGGEPGCTWGISAIGADTSPYTGEGITVAVLDTGIDVEHPCFKGRGVDLVCKNFTDDPEDNDVDGHGTHCAGTLFGRDVDGLRIGAAPGIKQAMIGKVIGRNGGTVEGIVDAIEWAVKGGAQIISMSLGIDFPGYTADLVREGLPPEVAASRALADYHDTARLFEQLHDFVATRVARSRHSVLLVAATGNESRRDENDQWSVNASPPSNARGVVAVAAVGPVPGVLDRSYAVAGFSNSGAVVAGPGEDVLSAWPGEMFRSQSGTSMATPHVAGVAALWGHQRLGEGKQFNADWIRSKLVTTSAPIGAPDELAGSGLARAPQAF